MSKGTRIKDEDQLAELLRSNPDSYQSPADSSDGSSRLSKSSRSTAKRRKGKSLQTSQSQIKQSKLCYNEGYCTLFNETVSLVHGEVPSGDIESMVPSQIGITVWSSQEKESFFASLAKRGRHDLPGIAAAVGTKTQLEVYVYLRLLQTATAEQHIHSHRNQLFDSHEIAGAYEVSQICCAELEQAADALAAMQRQKEEMLERKKDHELWLLDRKSTRWIDRQIRNGEEGMAKIRNRIPAAELLILKPFLNLSAGIFMNSSVAEENWRFHGRFKPSISFTAFSDLHTLAVSITKRLVQSTLFFAMSRLRAATGPRYVPMRLVRRQDVNSALNVLGMKKNPQNFWIGVARRCNLTVYNSEVDGRVTPEPLTYDAVEKGLSIGFHDGDDNGEGVIEDEEAARENDGTLLQLRISDSSCSSLETSPLQHSSDYETNSSICDTDNSVQSASPDPSTNPKKRRFRDHEAHDNALDAYAETLDRKDSRQEEQRLWALLGKDPPQPSWQEAEKSPQAPLAARRVGDDLDDWIAWVNYVPEWETYKLPIPLQCFLKNHRAATLKTSQRDRSPVGHSQQGNKRRRNKALSDEGSSDDSHSEDSVTGTSRPERLSANKSEDDSFDSEESEMQEPLGRNPSENAGEKSNAASELESMDEDED